MAENVRPPVAIRIVRPYSTEDDFLANELETVGKTSVILIGAHPRPTGVILRFEVTLANGATVLRGEGRVLAHKENAFRGQPGLSLRFTRLDPKSKALVDRAAGLRESRLSGELPVPPQASQAPAPQPRAEARPQARSSQPPLARPRGASHAPDPGLAQALTSETPPPQLVNTRRRSAAPPPVDDPPQFASRPPRKPLLELDPPTPPPPPVSVQEPSLPVQEPALASDTIPPAADPAPEPGYPHDALPSPMLDAPPLARRVATASGARLPPEDRDALLARLRERASRLSTDRVEAILRGTR